MHASPGVERLNATPPTQREKLAAHHPVPAGTEDWPRMREATRMSFGRSGSKPAAASPDFAFTEALTRILRRTYARERLRGPEGSVHGGGATA